MARLIKFNRVSRVAAGLLIVSAIGANAHANAPGTGRAIGAASPATNARALAELGARQIVVAHPIIPTPAAAWPALLGVAYVCRRVTRSTTRAR